MIARISEPESICDTGLFVTWRVMLSEAPSSVWRHGFLNRAQRIFGSSGSGVWIGGAMLLFEIERTCLRIGLERIDDWIAEANAEECTAGAPATDTVLVLGDEPQVRALAYDLLEERGYAVVETGDPWHALEIARIHRVDLLLADLPMNGMTSGALAERLASVSPETRILFMSGRAAQRELACATPFIAKPFTVEGFLRAVGDAMSSRSAFSRRADPSPPR